MTAPRWRKVWSDLVTNRRRTLLAALALGVGTFAVAAMLTAWAVLTREIDANFQATTPATVVAHFPGAGVDAPLARELEAIDGVAKAEARGMVEGRLELGPDEWTRAFLYTVDDFRHLRVSTFDLESGRLPSAPGEVLLERSAVRYLERGQGARLTVRAPGGPRTPLTVVGVVHDAAQSPGYMDHIAYVYLGRDTQELLGRGRQFDEVRILIRAGAKPADVAARVRQHIEARGDRLSWIDAVGAPRHPHAGQMKSLLFLFGGFGALSLVLAGVLAASVVSTLLTQQVRQIGTMKAVGATRAQVMRMYLGGVAVLAGGGLAAGLTLGVLGGLAYARFVAGVLNFDLTSIVVPAWVFLITAFAGLGIPLLAATLPVGRAAAGTAWEALSDVGFAARGTSTSAPGSRWITRPTLLSLRNMLRARGRLALTVGVLAVGGATFMSALDVSDGWQRAVDDLFVSRKFDLQIVVAQPMPPERLRELATQIEGVREAEPWLARWAFEPAHDGGEPYPLVLTGVPPETRMIDYPLLAGRWLAPDDTDAIVINHELAQEAAAGMRLGEQVSLTIDGKETSWRVVGIIKELGVRRQGQRVPASAYVSYRTLDERLGGGTPTSTIVLAATSRAAVQQLTPRVERALDAAGVAPTVVQPWNDRRQELLDHLVVIRNFLVAMALLVGAIGALALSSAMSVAVMERTREIGVMRAIGASRRDVVAIFLTEGLAVAILSWLCGIGLSLPLAHVLGRFAGTIFVHAPLPLVVSPSAVAAWLAVSLVIGAIASMGPARSATTGAVNAALHYA